MPKPEPEIVEQNPIEVPLYTHWDAARYLHVPLWPVFTLTDHFRGWPEPEFFFFYHFRRLPYPPLLDDDPLISRFLEERGRISFRRFADMFVRVATFQVLVEWSRGGERQRERWEDLYRAIWRGLEDTHREPVPFDGSPINERVDSLLAPYTRRLEDGERALLRKWLMHRMERVDVSNGMPVRIYPFSRDPAEKSPRIVVLDPRIRFGRPTIAETGVPTDSLFERYQAGDSVAELADDYGLTPLAVEEAIRYEALPPVPLFPFYAW